MAEQPYDWYQDWQSPRNGVQRWSVWRLLQSAAVLVLLGAAAMALVFDRLDTSPRKLSLIEENRLLQEQVVEADQLLTTYSERLAQLEQRDQELFRIMLQADTIPSAVRQVGIGGSAPDDMADRFDGTTRSIVRDLTKNLGILERRLTLQASSAAELMALAQVFYQRTEELPSLVPADGPIISVFGYRQHPVYKTRRFHWGVDITMPIGAPVHASGAGVIEEVVHRHSTFGTYVVIRHAAAGYKTLYAHLDSVAPNVWLGQRVARGAVIAFSGNTGLSVAPHLHYEVHNLEGRRLNPFPFLEIDMSTEERTAVLRRAAQQ